MPTSTNTLRQTDRILQSSRKIFCDRTEARAAFHALVKKAKKEKYESWYILYYSGIGGAGKSTLIRKLQEETKKRYIKTRTERKNRFIVSVNYAFSSPDEITTLCLIRKQLHEQSGMRFPAFDQAIRRYAVLTNIDLTEEKEQGIADKHPIIKHVFDIAGHIPVIGSVTGPLLSAVTAGQNIMNDINDGIESRQSQKDVRSLPEVLKALTSALNKDISQYCEKHKATEIYLFLDTYERLSNAAKVSGSSIQTIGWLWGENGLLSTMPNTVTVIAGRNHIRIPDGNAPKWYSEIVQCDIGQFSRKYTEEYLTSADVAQQEFDKIYTLTHGEPIYLDLCVEEYHNAIARGRMAGEIDYGVNTESLVERHTRYIGDELQDALYLCALLQRWNDALFDFIAGKVGISIQRSQLDQILSLSYIKTDEENVHEMHQVVSQILQKQYSASLRNETLEALIEYGREHFENVLWLEPAMRLAVSLENDPNNQGAADKTVGLIKEKWSAVNQYHWHLLYQQYIVSVLMEENFCAKLSPGVQSYLYYLFSDTLLYTSSEEAAEEPLDKAIAIAEECNCDKLDLAYLLKCKIIIETKKAGTALPYQELLKLLEKAEKCLTDSAEDAHGAVTGVSAECLGASIPYARGLIEYRFDHYREAVEYANQSVEAFKACSHKTDSVWQVSPYGLAGRAYSKLGKEAEAVKNAGEAVRLTRTEQQVFASASAQAHYLGNLATVYRNLNKTSEEIETLEKLIEFGEANNIEDVSYVASAQKRYEQLKTKEQTRQ